jgi:hypothetical protein
LTSRAASDILNSAGRDPFIFNEMVRHDVARDVARDFKAGESIGDRVI